MGKMSSDPEEHRRRTLAGLDAARARGAVLGRRRFKITPAGEHAIIDYFTGRIKSIGQLAEVLGCSRGKAHALAKGMKSISEDVP